MSNDARFEDGQDRPLRLKALDADDLVVIAALVQDAVFPASDIQWDAKARRFALLLNRFRWEDARDGASQSRPFERVRSILVIEDAEKVQSQGIVQTDQDMIYSLLSLTFQAGEDGTGRVELTLAGDGVIAIEVEALEVVLRDVTRPHAALSGKRPSHEE